MTEVHRLSALELAREIAGGACSAREVVDHHIARIEATHATINAVVWPRFEQARAEADSADAARARGEPLGPLHGVPITIKDHYDVAGLPTTCGVARLRDHVAAADGLLVAALKRAGAIVLGKTNVPQTMGVIETDNGLFGRTSNPWDPSRTCGGSSGGEAAAIAAGCSALGLGSDYGGSVRVPAAWCGIYGLRPTARRLPLDPIPVSTASGVEGLVSQPGPLARHPADLALAMKLMVEAAGHVPFTLFPPVPWRDPAALNLAGMKVALLPQVGDWPPGPAVRRALQEAAAALRRQGVTVEEWPDAPDLQHGVDLFFGIATADKLGFVRDLLAGEPPVPLMKPNMDLIGLPRALVPLVKAALRSSGQLRLHRMLSHGAPAKSADGLLRLLHQRAVLEADVLRRMAARRFDALLCPALPIAAPPHGTVNDMGDFWGSMLAFNVLGFPAGVAPVSRVRAGEESDRAPSRDKAVEALRRAEQGSAGLPVSVQVAAAPWREDIVLALLMALERECAGGSECPRAPPL